MIDAKDMFRSGRAQNFFDPEHIQKSLLWKKSSKLLRTEQKLLTSKS